MARHTFFLFWIVFFVQQSIGQTRPMACDILSVIAKEGRAFDGAQQELVLIDTCRFFTPDCGGRYGKYNITIVNKQPPRRIGKEQFYVIVGANKEGFAVGIYRWPDNSMTVYWLSILGTSISILKIKSGDF